MAECFANAIFAYSYLIYHPRDFRFAGFSVNLFENDTMVYTTYDGDRQATGQSVFRVAPEIRQRYFNMLNYADPWLRHVPDRIGSGASPMTESSFGFYGYEIFRVEDMEQMLGLSFGSQRGHYARLVYNLLQDISTVMALYSFDLRPDGLSWMSDVVEQLPLQYMNA